MTSRVRIAIIISCVLSAIEPADWAGHSGPAAQQQTVGWETLHPIDQTKLGSVQFLTHALRFDTDSNTGASIVLGRSDRRREAVVRAVAGRALPATMVMITSSAWSSGHYSVQYVPVPTALVSQRPGGVPVIGIAQLTCGAVQAGRCHEIRLGRLFTGFVPSSVLPRTNEGKGGRVRRFLENWRRQEVSGTHASFSSSTPFAISYYSSESGLRVAYVDRATLDGLLRLIPDWATTVSGALELRPK